MAGTAVESMPGGLLDCLHETERRPALRPVSSAGAVGAYASAQARIARLPADDPTTRAWRHFLWHGCWLSLPDGSARPMPHVIDKVMNLPARPRPETITRVEDWMVGRLLTELRDTRAILSPQNLAVAPQLALGVVGDALSSIEEARALAGTGNLSGHLDLLAADLVARANQTAQAEKHWQSAWHRLDAANDARGLAAAMVVQGDLRAGTLSSPVSWNCVLTTEPTAADNALVDSVEAAEFHTSAARMAAAGEAYADAMKRYEAVGDTAGVAVVALRHGYLAIADGQPDEAIELVSAAREVFTACHRPLDEATAIVQLALAKIAGNVLPEDIHLADQVMASAQVIGHAPVVGLGLLCVRMGRHWANGGRLEWGRAAFAFAERIWLGLGEQFLRVQSLVDIAGIAGTLGDVAAVRVGIQRALDADPEPLAEPADPGDVRRTRRAWLAARLYGFANKISDIEGMERASRTLHETLEPLRAGLQSFSGMNAIRAAHLLTMTDTHEFRLTRLIYQARSAQDSGNAADAADLLRQAHKEVERGPRETRDQGEALVKLYEGDNAGASDAFERYVRQTLESPTGQGMRAGEERMLHVQGLQFQVTAGDPVRARAHLDQLAGTGQWWAGLGPMWQHLAMEARLQELEGDLTAAARTMETVIDEIESVRTTLRRDEQKVSFYASAAVQNTYLDAARIALRLAEARDRDHWQAVAFGYGERARARALLDLMMANAGVENADLPADLPADLVKRWRSSSAEVALAQDRFAVAGQRDGVPAEDLARMRAELDEAVSRLQDVETELHQGNPRFSEVVNPQAAVSSLDQVAATLQDGTALIQYMISRTDLVAWAITSKGMVGTHRLTGRNGIARMVDGVVSGCTGHQDFTEQARSLADLLLHPFCEVIDASAEVVFVPSGPTMRLPFAVLPFNAKPLGLAKPLSIAPSASAIRRGPSAHGGGPALVVGNPAGMTYRPADDTEVMLSALPGAAREAAEIAHMIPGAILLTGDDATEERVRELLPHAQIAHFATHGLLDVQAPLASSIAVASGGQVTMAELAGERLSAELVVLSACHTGTGTAMSGDELLGLGRVLLAAGARSAVVSLWAVNDRSAALLMTEFHRRRLAGESHPAALKSACAYLRGLGQQDADNAFEQLHGIDESLGADRARNIGGWAGESHPFGHPYHWAPFVVISAG